MSDRTLDPIEFDYDFFYLTIPFILCYYLLNLSHGMALVGV